MDKEERSLSSRRGRGRGRYGESRLSKLVHGVVVGRSKFIELPSKKVVKINHNQPPDVLSELFSYENKHDRQTPRWLDEVMTQAVTNAPEGFIPVAHVRDHVTGKYYFILREEDFVDLLVEERKSVEGDEC